MKLQLNWLIQLAALIKTQKIYKAVTFSDFVTVFCYKKSSWPETMSPFVRNKFT